MYITIWALQVKVFTLYCKLYIRLYAIHLWYFILWMFSWEKCWIHVTFQVNVFILFFWRDMLDVYILDVIIGFTLSANVVLSDILYENKNEWMKGCLHERRNVWKQEWMNACTYDYNIACENINSWCKCYTIKCCMCTAVYTSGILIFEL